MSKLIKFSFCLAVSMVLAVVISGNNGARRKPQSSQPYAPSGVASPEPRIWKKFDHGYIAKHQLTFNGIPIVVIASDAAYDDVSAASRARDMQELAILIAKKDAFMVPVGTRIKIVETGVFSMKVRTPDLSEGWMSRDYLSFDHPGR